jgi:outer membrane protein
VKAKVRPAFSCFAAAALLLSSPVWAADLKIGVVDYSRLMQDSPQAKAALEAIRTEFTPKQRDLQNQQNSLKAREDKLTKDSATMAPDQRTKAEKDLRDAYRDLQRKQSEVQDDFNSRRNEETSRLQRTLIEQVRTYAKAQGFDLVVADGVIYANNTLDITPQILTALQGQAPGAKPATQAAPTAATPN